MPLSMIVAIGQNGKQMLDSGNWAKWEANAAVHDSGNWSFKSMPNSS